MVLHFNLSLFSEKNGVTNARLSVTKPQASDNERHKTKFQDANASSYLYLTSFNHNPQILNLKFYLPPSSIQLNPSPLLIAFKRSFNDLKDKNRFLNFNFERSFPIHGISNILVKKPVIPPFCRV
jgi:hypothetical protein